MLMSNRHTKPAMTAKSNASDTELDKILYADDQAFIFTSRLDLIRESDIIYRLLVRFGLMMHVGKNGGKSKTEAKLIPGLGRKHEDGYTSDYDIDNGIACSAEQYNLCTAVQKAKRLSQSPYRHPPSAIHPSAIRHPSCHPHHRILDHTFSIFLQLVDVFL